MLLARLFESLPLICLRVRALMCTFAFVNDAASIERVFNRMD
jgi:hypothetical protein